MATVKVLYHMHPFYLIAVLCKHHILLFVVISSTRNTLSTCVPFCRIIELLLLLFLSHRCPLTQIFLSFEGSVYVLS